MTIQASHFFKCLSDETRLFATLLIFEEGELCVCELMEALEFSQPKISRHLAQLRNCGILSDARRQQWVYYSIAKDLPDWASKVLSVTRAGNLDSLRSMQRKLKAMADRPCC